LRSWALVGFDLESDLRKAALVYGTGGLVLSLRYDGFGLTGPQPVAYTSREVLLFHGARSLEKQKARVIQDNAASRRDRLPVRLGDIEIR